MVFVSITNGDAGHQTLGEEVLARKRYLEAQEAGRRFGVEYIVVDITGSFDRKIYGMAAHETQFFQWQPWIAKTLDEVPDTEEERLKWLADMSGSPMTPEKHKSLVKWYGPERATRVKVTESFEICEYGKQPTDEEIRRLFPMLGN